MPGYRYVSWPSMDFWYLQPAIFGVDWEMSALGWKYVSRWMTWRDDKRWFSSTWIPEGMLLDGDPVPEIRAGGWSTQEEEADALRQASQKVW